MALLLLSPTILWKSSFVTVISYSPTLVSRSFSVIDLRPNIKSIFCCFQLLEIVLENGLDAFGIPMEVKKDLLLNLHEASSSTETAEDWDGVPPDQLLLQLASAWEIDLQQHD